GDEDRRFAGNLNSLGIASRFVNIATEGSGVVRTTVHCIVVHYGNRPSAQRRVSGWRVGRDSWRRDVGERIGNRRRVLPTASGTTTESARCSSRSSRCPEEAPAKGRTTLAQINRTAPAYVDGCSVVRVDLHTLGRASGNRDVTITDCRQRASAG